MSTNSRVADDGAIQDTTVYDVDVHVTYNGELQREVARYMDKPYRNYVDPDAVKGGKDFRYPSEGIPKDIGGKRKFEITDVTDAGTVTAELCDGFGVDHPVLNVLAPLDSVFTSARAVEEMQGINNVVLDRFLDENDDFLGAISLSLRRPEAAVEEIERLGDEKQVVGAFMVSGQEFQRPIGDPSYDVVYEALADNGLTPMYHATNFSRKVRVLRDYETGFEHHSVAGPWSIMYGLVSLIGQGVPAKFPELNFVMLEGGVGWVPFYMARLNREYNQWRSELPLLEQSPEAYLRDQFYFATQPLGEFDDPRDMVRLLETVGAESLMFATDFPHYDFDNPKTIDRFFRQMEADDRERVLNGNAVEALLGGA